MLVYHLDALRCTRFPWSSVVMQNFSLPHFWIRFSCSCAVMQNLSLPHFFRSKKNLDILRISINKSGSSLHLGWVWDAWIKFVFLFLNSSWNFCIKKKNCLQKYCFGPDPDFFCTFLFNVFNIMYITITSLWSVNNSVLTIRRASTT